MSLLNATRHGKGWAILAALVGWVMLGLTPAAQAQSSLDERWTHSYSPMGVNGRVQAVLESSGDVYAGGAFTRAGAKDAAYLARYRAATTTLPARWDTVATDLDGDVFVIVENPNDNAELFIGGSFTTAGGVTVNGLARYRKSTGVITAVSSGVSGFVRDIAFNGTDMYVGGVFTSAGGNTASNVAVYDLVNNAWRTLDGGVGGQVYAIERIGRDIFVGGSFTTAGSETVNNIARWSINTEAWFPLENLSFTLGVNEGVSGPVYAMEVNGTNLYAAGNFTVNVDDGGVTATNIARWSTTTATWEELSDGTGEGTNGPIYALDLEGTNLYAGGDFTMAGSDMIGYVAQWDITGSVWTALGSNPLTSGTTGIVRALDVDATTTADLWIGGDFVNVSGNFGTNRLARWDDSADEFLGLGWGANGPIFATHAVGNFLYVGGDFTAIGGMRVNNVARLQIAGGSLAWTRLTDSGGANGVDGPVHAIASANNGAQLFVGGNFDFMADGAGLSAPANNVAHWDGTNWLSVGTGTVGTNGPVYALAVQNPAAVIGATNVLAVGGDFTSPASYLVRTAAATGGALVTVDNGTNGPVYALAIGFDPVNATASDRLYVGGDFSTIDAAVANNLAAVDDIDGGGAGTTARQLVDPGDGPNGPVYDLTVEDGGAATLSATNRLYVGGDFTAITVDGTPTTSPYVVSLTALAGAAGTAASLANATLRTVDAPVRGLAWDESEGFLYVGGAFTTAGDSTSVGVAQVQTDGTWSTLGSGTDNMVHTVTTITDAAEDDVFVGGDFMTVGNGLPSRSLGFFNVLGDNVSVGGGGGTTPTTAPTLYGPNISGADIDFYAPETTDIEAAFPFTVTFAWSTVENAVGYKLFYFQQEDGTDDELDLRRVGADPNRQAIYTTDTTYTIAITDIDIGDDGEDEIVWLVCPTLDTEMPTTGTYLTHADAGNEDVFAASAADGDGPCASPTTPADNTPAGGNANVVSALVLDLNEIDDIWPTGADRTFMQTVLDNTGGVPADHNFQRQGTPGTALTAGVLPLSIDPQVGGADIQNGDIVVALFTDPTDDELKAAGYGVWSGADLAFTIYGDNPATTAYEGLAGGEFMRFLLFRSAENGGATGPLQDDEDNDLFIVEYEFENAGKFFDPQTVYRFSYFNAITEDQVTAEHLITLDAGWNLISTILNPNGDDGNTPDVDTRIGNVFTGAADSASVGFVGGAADDFVLARSLDGGLFYPEFSVDNIGFYDYREGYQVFMNAADTLRIVGAYPFGTAERTIALTANTWYILPYLMNEVQPIDEVFGDAAIAANITAVRDNEGNAFIPAFGINQIEFMRPGRAYWVYANANGNFIYPEISTEAPDSILSRRNAALLSGLDQAQVEEEPYFTPVRTRTGSSSILVVQSPTIRPGDQLAVRTESGLIVGTGVAEAEGQVSITVWGDDTITEEVDGALANERLDVLAYIAQTAREHDVQILAVEDVLTGTVLEQPVVRYADNAIYAGTVALDGLAVSNEDDSTLPTAFDLGQNYPNPFNPTTAIRYDLPEASAVTLKVYDIMGRQVATLVNEAQQAAGRYVTQWNGLSITGQPVASGVYFYTLEAGSFVQTNRMVLLK